MLLLFTAATLLSISINAGAWWIGYHDPSHSLDLLDRVVLWTNSASALLFVFTLLLAISDTITQVSVTNIGSPNFFLCFCLIPLSLLKIRYKLYRAVLVSSVILTLEWLLAISLC